jgi:hypothetical protein
MELTLPFANKWAKIANGVVLPMYPPPPPPGYATYRKTPNVTIE